jgi:hypothetical protein
MVETGAGMRKANNMGTPPTAEELKKVQKICGDDR